MDIPVLYTEGNISTLVKMAGKLAQDFSWRPVYWVGGEATRAMVSRSFPQAVFHPQMDAVRGLPAPGEPRQGLIPPDQPLLEEMSACEAMVLRMMDRMDPGGFFSLRERLDLYYRYLGYWTAVLENHRPKVVFFPLAPHAAYDYVIYRLCRKRGIATIMLEQAMINSRLYPVSSFEDRETVITAEYRRLLTQGREPQDQLAPDVAEHLAGFARPYSPPFYVTRMNTKGPSLAGGLSEAWMALKSLPALVMKQARAVKRILTTPAPPNYMKVRGRPFEGRPISHLEFAYYRRLGIRQRVRLKRIYQGLAKAPDLGLPYVFMPLHYQPEMSTNPTGGFYEDQRLMAALVSSCLPPGWLLYVKEHPVQVSDEGRGNQGRTEGYYQDLLSLPNLRLVPLTHTSWDLIDNARLTVTITGQAGWEAVNRGKPACVFGSAWYRGCEGVFQVQTREDLVQVLQKLEQGYQVDQGKVALFALAVQRTARQAYVDQLFAREYGLNEDDNSLVLSSLVGDFWTKAQTL